MDLNKEEHPDWYHDLPVMKTLILGSFPPHGDKWTYPFYYPNAQNRFWRVLARIAQYELSPAKGNPERAVRERQTVMEKLQTGVQNLGKTIQRKGKSSLDTDIEITEFQDILGIIRRHPELQRILLPGYSAKNSTFQAFKRYMETEGIAFPVMRPGPETEFTITVDGHTLECVVLYSTSTATKIPEAIILQQFSRWIL